MNKAVGVAEVSQAYLAAERAVPVGYKKSEVGVIPEDWSVCSLGELSNFVTSGSRGWAKFYSNHGALFVRSQNVRNGNLDLKDRQFVTPKVGAEGDRTRLKLYDLLITITGNSVGNVALVEKELGDAYISQHVGLVRFKDVESAKYICIFLSPHSIGNRQILASQSGQSKPGLTLKNLNEFLIVVPAYRDEQTAIANALSDVDALLSELEKLIAKKQAIKTATMQQLLTGRTRLPQFALREDGSPKGYKQSELGEVPEDWGGTTLGQVAKINMGQSPSSRNYNQKGIGMPLVQGNADISKRKTIIRNHTTQITKTANKGDLILSVRAPVGEVARATFNCCIGRGVCAIRDKNGYLYHWLVGFESEWKKFSKGSTFDSINSNELREIELIIPADEEQTAIATILSDMDEENQALEQRLDKTRQIKQGMMQELLTGRIRLVQPFAGVADHAGESTVSA